MEDLFGPYTMWVIVGLIIAAFVGIGWLWNYKLRPNRLAKEIAFPTFGRQIKFLLQAAFRDNGDKNSRGLGKLNWTIAHAIIVTASAAAIYLWVKGILKITPEILFGTIIVFAIISLGRIMSTKRKRLNQIKEMFEIVNPKLFYLKADKRAKLHPWDFINVTKLTEDGKVAEATLVLPPTFSVSSSEARVTFEKEFAALMSSSAESAWKFEWKPEKRFLKVMRIPPLPTFVEYKGSADKPWNTIPLGLSNEGEECWDLSDTPQALFVGLTGSGKSVLQRSIIFHAIQHPDDIEIYGIDLKRTELPIWRNYPGIKKVAVELEDALEIMTYVEDEMMERFTLMEKQKKDHIDKVSGKKHKAILVIVEEAAQCLMQGSGASPEAKEENAIRATITDRVQKIAALGRAAKVHQLVCTQRAEVAAIGGGSTKNNMGFRIMLGHGDKTASQMALDSMSGTETEPHKGRGVISRNGQEVKFQAYFGSEKWCEENNIAQINAEEPLTNDYVSTYSEAMEIVAQKTSVDTPENVDHVAVEEVEDNIIHPIGQVIENTDDGMVEYLLDDEYGTTEDDEYGFTPMSFSQDTILPSDLKTAGNDGENVGWVETDIDDFLEEEEQSTLETSKKVGGLVNEDEEHKTFDITNDEAFDAFNDLNAEMEDTIPLPETPPQNVERGNAVGVDKTSNNMMKSLGNIV